MFLFCFSYQTEAKSLFLLSLSVDYYELDNTGIDFHNITLPEVTSIFTHKKTAHSIWKKKARRFVY